MIVRNLLFLLFYAEFLSFNTLFIGSGSFLIFGLQYGGNMFWFYVWISRCFIGAFLIFRICTYDRVFKSSTFKVNVSRKMHILFELYPSKGSESHEWVHFLVAITHHKGKKKIRYEENPLTSIRSCENCVNSFRSHLLKKDGASFVTQMVKNLRAVQETQVWFLHWDGLLEKGMAAHSSILAWRIPLTEELGGLQSMGHKESDTTEWLTLT